MSTPHESFHARRVVTGVDADGKSTIVFDGPSDTRTYAPGWTLNDIWQVDALPPAASDGNSLVPGESIFAPAPGGFVWRLAMLPPDSTWKPPARGGEVDGMHVTETLDIITILSGEVYAVLEDCETLLRSGDSIVQRGTVHAWANRSDQPCISVSAIMPLTR
jgi:hypothetical protein